MARRGSLSPWFIVFASASALVFVMTFVLVVLLRGGPSTRLAPAVSSVEAPSPASGLEAAHQPDSLAEPESRNPEPESADEATSVAGGEEVPKPKPGSRRDRAGPTYEDRLLRVRDERLPHLAMRLLDTARSLAQRRATLDDLIKIERDYPDLGAIPAILGLGLGEDTDLTSSSLLGNAARELTIVGTESTLAASSLILESQSEATRMAAAMALSGAIRDGRIEDHRARALLVERSLNDSSPRVRELLTARLEASSK